VVHPQAVEDQQVLEQVTRERGCKLICIGQDILVDSSQHTMEDQTIQVWTKPEQDKPAHPISLVIPLLGQHQVFNAATAYGALVTAAQAGLPISEDAIRIGFARVQWPARFEVIQRHPPVVLDCAHNRDSALKLRLTLDDYFPDWPVILLFGASEDKDIAGMFAELLPRTRELIAVKSFHPRAIDPDTLQALAKPYMVPVQIIPEIVDAFNEAQKRAGGDALILVTGSIFVAAAVRIAWHKQQAEFEE
jgi:dihydrofolate synthase/folylpolyglutamate synthase